MSGAHTPNSEQLLDQVRALAAKTGAEVHLGYEVLLTPDLPDRLRAGEASTLAGSTAVLVEVPLAGWPHHADATLFALQTAGYRPVLAHPERYPAIGRDPAVARDLADRGIVLQVTLGSLVGLFGREAQRAAERLVVDGIAHLVATDAHSCGRRFLSVYGGLDRLRALVGEPRLRQLTDDVPRALLAGAPLPEPVPARRSWRGRLDAARKGWWRVDA